MRNLNFYYLYARNFLCFGSEGIEIDFGTLDRIAIIKGKNWDDAHEGTNHPGSNGTGKSSIQEILVYALFGKPVKPKLIKKNMLHNQIKKDMTVEVCWDDFRVVRTSKPDSLRIWESKSRTWDVNTEITKGAGMPETQKLIEQKLGLNYRSFINLAIFDDRNHTAFLECDGPTKREIIENLLSLDVYRGYSKSAKEIAKEIESSIKSLSSQYERLLIDADSCKARLEKSRHQEKNWKSQGIAELEGIIESVKSARDQMASLDQGDLLAKWDHAQESIASLRSQCDELGAKRAKIRDASASAQAMLDSLRESQSRATLELSTIASEESSAKIALETLRQEGEKIARMEPGVVCRSCLSPVDPSHYESLVSQNEIGIQDAKKSFDEIRARLDKFNREKIAPISAKISNINSAIDSANGKLLAIEREIKSKELEILSLSRLPKPDVGPQVAVLEERINSLKARALSKKEMLSGPSPYAENIRDNELDLERKISESSQKKLELSEREKLLPYCQFWLKGFGDDGIRKMVIDGIVPALNDRISRWLRVLIDERITLKFDNALEETIGRVPFDGDPFIYPSMSGGEKRRINLAVNQSFAHVMALSAGACPNVVFLDEVSINIDENGIEGVHNMIRELSLDKQVFVITHDQNLLDLLEGCSTIELERRGGFTKKVG